MAGYAGRPALKLCHHRRANAAGVAAGRLEWARRERERWAQEWHALGAEQQHEANGASEHVYGP